MLLTVELAQPSVTLGDELLGVCWSEQSDKHTLLA
jgi:hypothetical protein